MSTKSSNTKVSTDINGLLVVFAINPDAFVLYIYAKKQMNSSPFPPTAIEAANDWDPLNLDDLPEWQKEDTLRAHRIIQYPEQYAFFSWDDAYDAFQVMEDFCFTIENNNLREKLLNQLGGKGQGDCMINYLTPRSLSL